MPRKPDNISQEDWDAVDSPPLSDRMLRGMRPAREVLRPALFEKLTKVRGPQKTPTKEAVSLRLDRDVLDHFRAKGRGWQTEINDALRERAEAETIHVVKSSEGQGWTVQKQTTVGRSVSLGTFATKTAAVNAATSLKNPATASQKTIKGLAASALTQRSGLSPATRRDKKRSK